MSSRLNAPAAAPPPGAAAIAAVVLGNALEFFDFVVYAAFAVIIGQAFFPASDAYLGLLLSVSTFGLGFIVRPLGAWWFGAYADRHGRKPAMLITARLMGLSCIALVLLPDYAALGPAAPLLLLLVRLLQGLAWGGEAGPATAYILEVAPLRWRGRYAAWQVIAQGLASILAGLLGYVLARQLDDQAMQHWGWRLPFALGCAIWPLGQWMRRRLHDSWQPSGQSTWHLSARLWRDHKRPLGLGVAMLAGSTITQYVLNYMTTYALIERHFPAGTAMLATLVVGGGLALGAGLGGYGCDRWGRRAVLLWPRVILSLAILPGMQWLAQAPPAGFFTALAALTLLHGISGAALIVLLAESFPSAQRALGFSAAYALGISLFGGTAQPITSWLLKVSGQPTAPGWYLLAANLVTLLAGYLAPETARPGGLKRHDGVATRRRDRHA